jgi:hypothetical protein
MILEKNEAASPYLIAACASRSDMDTSGDLLFIQLSSIGDLCGDD